MAKEKCGQCRYFQHCVDAGEGIKEGTSACREFEEARNSKKSDGGGKGILAKNISFEGCKEPLEEVFGKEPISRADVVKRISAYIKANNLVR